MKISTRIVLASVVAAASLIGASATSQAADRVATSPSPIWSSALAGSEDNQYVWIQDVATLQDGGSVAVGAFSRTLTVGTGSNTRTIQATGNEDGFIARYDSSGAVVALTHVPSSISSEGVLLNSVTATPDGGFALTARVEGSADFGPNGTGRVEMPPFQRGIAIAKYSAAGALEWVEQSRGEGRSACHALEIQADPLGVLHIGGWAQGTVQLGSGADTRTIGQRANMVFTARYSPEGRLLSAANISDTLEPNNYNFGRIAVGPDGTVTVVGYVDNAPASFGTGATQQVLSAPGQLVAQLNPAGQLKWVTGQASGPFQSTATDVAVGPNGQVFVGGTFWRSVTLGSGNNTATLTSRGGDDAYVASYSSTGQLLWAQAFGTPTDDWLSDVKLIGGSVVINGLFRGRMSVSSSISLESEPQAAFLVGLSPAGTARWATQTTGRWGASSRAISGGLDGSITMVGWFGYSVSFGDEYPQLTLAPPSGATNSFIVRYQQPSLPAPSPPRSVRVTPGDGFIAVTWVPPGLDGGSPITGYTATASPSGLACQTTGSTSCIITGLENGVAQTVTVTATNGSSTSEPSDPSASVTPEAKPVRPGAVTALKAVGTAGAVTVTWAPPAGASPTRYDYRVGRGKWTATSSLTVTVKAKRGATITVAVRAVNTAGAGPVSVATARAK